uniref:Uncharacterized protein n=1 Tax=Ditylenchus dipsaci TaxID=166011 RepID=A0A915DLC5_9BILA
MLLGADYRLSLKIWININNYRVSNKSKKWWFSCFSFCLDSAIHNACSCIEKTEGVLTILVSGVMLRPLT